MRPRDGSAAGARNIPELINACETPVGLSPKRESRTFRLRITSYSVQLDEIPLNQNNLLPVRRTGRLPLHVSGTTCTAYAPLPKQDGSHSRVSTSV